MVDGPTIQDRWAHFPQWRALLIGIALLIWWLCKYFQRQCSPRTGGITSVEAGGDKAESTQRNIMKRVAPNTLVSPFPTVMDKEQGGRSAGAGALPRSALAAANVENGGDMEHASATEHTDDILSVEMEGSERDSVERRSREILRSAASPTQRLFSTLITRPKPMPPATPQLPEQRLSPLPPVGSSHQHQVDRADNVPRHSRDYPVQRVAQSKSDSINDQSSLPSIPSRPSLGTLESPESLTSARP